MTTAQRVKFLALVAEDRTIGNKRALRQAGVKLTERQFNNLLADDEEFRADYNHARGRDYEEIRAEIRRRAIDGVEEPVYHLGAIVGHVTKYSDRMLELMAKAQVPEYGDKTRVELAVEGSLEVTNSDVAATAERLRTLVDSAARRASSAGESSDPGDVHGAGAS